MPSAVQLSPHPACPQNAIRSVDVTVTSSASRLSLTYRVCGDIKSLIIPPPTAPGRANSLWRTTCFELFIRAESAAYREFHFSPSGQWAAYTFDSYRNGMNNAPAQVHVVLASTSQALTLAATVDADLADVQRLALTAVVEHQNGLKSYWSLAHPTGAPDFHHPSCFALALADIGTV